MKGNYLSKLHACCGIDGVVRRDHRFQFHQPQESPGAGIVNDVVIMAGRWR